MSCTRINSGNSNRETHASYPHSDNLPVEIISHLFEDGLSVGDVISAPVAVTSARFRILDLSALLRRLLVVFSDSRIHLTSEEHIIHGYHFGNLYLNSTPATKFYLDTNILAIEAFTNRLSHVHVSIAGLHTYIEVKQPAWKCATTEWWAVRFLHRLQQEVGQIMECTIPQQMCITHDHRGFKINGSGGYELLSCLADLDGQQYLFQIRITPYNFTPRHRTFTVSAIRGYGFKPMKTVRPDEFASPYSEDSIISIASRSDNQMSFLLSTIDHIDEVKFVDTLGIYRFV
ncbi:hypothetical protein HID58_033516, partial [Brassica napus]